MGSEYLAAIRNPQGSMRRNVCDCGDGVQKDECVQWLAINRPYLDHLIKSARCDKLPAPFVLMHMN